jgi:hypothetical protein
VRKAPRTKLQAPEKLQKSNLNEMQFCGFLHQPSLYNRAVETWNLELLWMLDVGAWIFSGSWILVFGIFSSVLPMKKPQKMSALRLQTPSSDADRISGRALIT